MHEWQIVLAFGVAVGFGLRHIAGILLDQRKRY